MSCSCWPQQVLSRGHTLILICHDIEHFLGINLDLTTSLITSSQTHLAPLLLGYTKVNKLIMRSTQKTRGYPTKGVVDQYKQCTRHLQSIPSYWSEVTWGCPKTWHPPP